MWAGAFREMTIYNNKIPSDDEDEGQSVAWENQFSQFLIPTELNPIKTSQSASHNKENEEPTEP